MRLAAAALALGVAGGGAACATEFDPIADAAASMRDADCAVLGHADVPTRLRLIRDRAAIDGMRLTDEQASAVYAEVCG